MTLAPGATTNLYYDSWDVVEPGDVLQTNTGRRYLVQESRRSKTKPIRMYLDVVVMAPDDPNPDQGNVFHLAWYKRERAREPFGGRTP